MQEEARRPEEVIYRICRVCRESKLLSEFYHDKTKKLGRKSICKRCANDRHKQYCITHKEQIAEYMRKYHIDNREQIAEYMWEYRLEHKEETAAYGKKYCKDHKEEVKARSKKYNEEHKEQMAEWQRRYSREKRKRIAERERRYRQTPKGRLVANCGNQRRRSRKLDAEGDGIAPEAFQRIIKNQHGKCNLCAKRFCKSLPATMDHIIALSKGGPHDSSNVQALCKSCNSRKQAKIMKKFIISW